MALNKWLVVFETQSSRPCTPCRQMSELSPYVETTVRLQTPDIDRYRPHERCACRIEVLPVDLLSGSESDYVVTNLTAGAATVTDRTSMVVDTPTNAGSREPREITVEDNRSSTTTIELSTGFGIDGNLEGFGVSLAAQVSQSNSTTTSISGSTTVTLQPGEGIYVLRVQIQTTTPVWGLLKHAVTGETVEQAHFVGYVMVDDAYNVLGDTFSLN